jgi:MoaA/NifB/PqqE/SkfB family radical SAM enzyme
MTAGQAAAQARAGVARAEGILILSLASACGCDCVFCGLPDSKPHTVLPRETLIGALEDAPGGRWREVNLTGGDPLVIPAARALFAEVLARRDRFEELSVSTAGVPAKPALAGLRALAGQVPLSVYVSLDGVGPLHDRVRGRLGAFREVEAFLAEARQAPAVKIALTCVINRLNVDGLDELADYAAERGLPISYALVNSSDHYIRSLPMYGDVSLTPEQQELATDFLLRRSSQRLDEDLRRVLDGGRRELPCRLLHDGVLVTSDGEAAICGTSRRMVLGRLVPGDPDASLRAALERRPELLDAGAGEVCGTCTTNCYAWRKSDAAVS